jgi:hypothetical protein
MMLLLKTVSLLKRVHTIAAGMGKETKRGVGISIKKIYN